jgi:tetratricopeptide (TPR) repeat protein
MAYAPLSYDPWEMPPEERKARLVGREVLLQTVLSAIADQQEHQTVQHYLLLGPRGIGKTTLLLTLRDRVRETPSLSARWLCVQLREEEYFIRTLRDLLDLVLQSLAEDERIPDAAELAARVHGEPNEQRSLAIAVDGLRSIAAANGRRILLLIDNFDRVFPATATGRRKTRAPESEFRGFRKLLSTESFLMVIGASVRLFEEIAAYDRAFFNFFCPVEVPNLTEEEISELLRRCAEMEGNAAFLQHFDALRDKVRAITYMTGGNPRLVLMLYDVLRHREMMPVVQALRETVGGLTPLLKHVLDDMPRQQSKTLDALARLRGAASPNDIARLARLPLNVVTTQLGRLKEARFVALDGGGKGKPATYRVADPMFHTWYQMRYLRPAGRRIELFVDFIRAWFSVEERRRFLEEQWSDLQAHRRVGEAALTIEHYAASLEDVGERQEHVGRLADVLVEEGRKREAAMLLAESVESAGLTGRRIESVGYRLLGGRMLKKGSLVDAREAFSEALKNDPKNIEATLGLGVCFARSGEHSRALAEFNCVAETPGLPLDDFARAVVNRGISKQDLGDIHGAIADFTAVVGLPGAPADRVARALVSRAFAKGALSDTQGAIADCTAALEMPGAPPDEIAKALVGRASAKGTLGDTQGAIADYTAVVELPGAPPDEIAKALVWRSEMKWSLGDREGAMADYTAAITLPGASTLMIALALAVRGIAFVRLGHYDKGLSDFGSVVEVQGIPVELTSSALLGSAVAFAVLHRNAEAVARCEQCLALRATVDLVHRAFAQLIRLHLLGERPDEAARSMSRLHQWEPEDTPIERRLEVRTEVIVTAARDHTPETAGSLLKALLESDPEDVRARMAFLVPALEYASTGNEQALSGLPDRERDAARQIAASIKGKGNGVARD